jgi:hypothetical protein
MGNEFEAPTNVMQGDLLRELTDKIRDQREVVIEAEPPEQPAAPTVQALAPAFAPTVQAPAPAFAPTVQAPAPAFAPTVQAPAPAIKPTVETPTREMPQISAPVAAEPEPIPLVNIKSPPPRRGSSLAVMALLATAFVVGFFGTRRLLPILRYLDAHHATVVPASPVQRSAAPEPPPAPAPPTEVAAAAEPVAAEPAAAPPRVGAAVVPLADPPQRHHKRKHRR